MIFYDIIIIMLMIKHLSELCDYTIWTKHDTLFPKEVIKWMRHFMWVIFSVFGGIKMSGIDLIKANFG